VEADLSRVSDREHSLTDFACGTDALSREAHPQRSNRKNHSSTQFLDPQMWDSMIGICRREFCTPDDVCSYVAESVRDSRKQIWPGPDLRTPREMANTGNFENKPSILFNLWRK
jgi:hypothetical protein